MSCIYDKISSYALNIPISESWQFTIGVTVGTYIVTRVVKKALEANPSILAILNTPLRILEENYPGTTRFIKVALYDNLPLAALVISRLFFSAFDGFDPELRRRMIIAVLSNTSISYWASNIFMNALVIGVVCGIADVARKLCVAAAPRVYSRIRDPYGPALARLLFFLRPSDSNANAERVST